MSKGPRILLRVFQVLFLLGALVFLTLTFLEAYADFGMTDMEDRFVDTWVIGCALLAVVFSPSLWSTKRGVPAAPAASGTYDRVPPQAAPAPQQPGKPGGVFEPMNPASGPAAPASSYGQPSAGFGSQPQGESPWGSGR